MQPTEQEKVTRLSAEHTSHTSGGIYGTAKKARTFVAPSIMRRENIQCLIFPRVDIGIANAPPGSWFKDNGDAVVICPMCGTKHAIPIQPGGYKIDARGVLYPSVLCPKDECTFDRYVLLQGWQGMGKLGRKKDNERGVILYSLAWRKWVNGPYGWAWYLQPFEYCHAVNQAEAEQTWAGLINLEKGRIVGIAPSVDFHVSGDADPRESILHL